MNTRHSTRSRLACSVMLLTSLFSGGCFYLVKEGQGGVAERFNGSPSMPSATEREIANRHYGREDKWLYRDIQQRFIRSLQHSPYLSDQRFLARLYQCQEVKRQAQHQKLQTQYPNFYAQLDALMTRSLRLQVAGLEKHASEALSCVEKQLQQAASKQFTPHKNQGLSCARYPVLRTISAVIKHAAIGSRPMQPSLRRELVL